MTKKKRSARREQALAAQRAKERQQLFRIGGIAAVVLVVLAGLVWLANRPKLAETTGPVGAVGAAWGPADAPIVIEEWADFN